VKLGSAVAVHGFRPEYGPFRNICALPDERAEAILADMRDRYGFGWLVPSYLRERREVEAWLREGFRAKGGHTVDLHPIYLSLNPVAPRPSNDTIIVPLERFAADTLSLTYPDSMISYGISHWMRPGEEHERRPYHGEVFRLEEIEAVIDRYGWPGEPEGRELRSNYDKSIEVQVWDHAPLRDLVSDRAPLGR